jgi:hypothetical protein
MLSALLGAILLKETHPEFANRLDPGQRLLSYIHSSVWRLFGFNHAGYTALQQTTAPVDEPTVVREEEHIELQALEDADSVSDERQTPDRTYTSKVVLQILSVSLLAFHKVSSDVLVPVFLASPSVEANGNGTSSSTFASLSGGFGMSTTQIGYLLFSQAAIATAAQILFVSKVITWVGVLKLYRWLLLGFPWLYGFLPLTTTLPYALAVVALVILQWISVVLVAIGYVCCSIL